LKPPPPYCSERLFHSTGRLTWNLTGGALGSVGSIWPSTLQKAGLAGVIRAAGVGACSDSDRCEADCMAALSIRTDCHADPARPLQVAAGSPAKLAASAAGAANEAANAPPSQGRAVAIDSTHFR